MQPQGHLQLLVNLLDYRLDVQSAIDAPRFWWEEGRRVVIEAGVSDATCATLTQWGHEVYKTRASRHGRRTDHRRPARRCLGRRVGAASGRLRDWILSACGLDPSRKPSERFGKHCPKS